MTEIRPRLRVLLNASALPAQPAGAGVSTLELAAALAERDEIELTVATPHPLGLGCAEIASPEAGPAGRSAWEQRSLPGLLGAFDVYHGAHFATPLRSPIPSVATVHDLAVMRLPQRYPRLRRAYYRLLAESTRRATRVIAPSHAVAADITELLGRDPSTIDVVYEAPRTGYAPAEAGAIDATLKLLGVKRPYALCVGTAEPGKRAIDAIRALALLHERGLPLRLVLAGNEGPLSGPLRYQAGMLGVSEYVHFVGYAGEDVLRGLYSGAIALVFPSLIEGFGLPPVEAMACGAPVIASDAPAMNEVLGAAAILVPPRSPDAIADRLAELMEDDALRVAWSARGRAHAGTMNWTRAASETVDVYRTAAWA